MKLIISTITGGIVLFLLGWIFYGAIFMSFFSSQITIGRDAGDFKMWSIIVANFIQAFIMALMYAAYHKGESPFKDGLIFGFFAGILITVPTMFYFWSRYAVKWQAVVLDGAIMFFMTLVCGLVIGMIYKKKSTG